MFLLLVNTAQAQVTSTEDFEDEVEGATSFTDNGQVFDITSQVGTFSIFFDADPYGWNGTEADNKFIDNTGDSNPNSNFDFAISTEDEALFNVNSLWIFLAESSNTGLNLSVPGSLTFEGKLDGVTQFTVTQNSSSGFNNTSFSTANGFTFINFESFGSQDVTDMDIDELVISSTASFNYCSLDAFTWTTVPESTNTPPTVSTSFATSVTGTSADLGGNVTDTGGEVVTERGVVYSSTATIPTIGGSGVIKEPVGSGMGSFQFSAYGLTINTTYYFRAYAINSEGISYGNVQTFTTLTCDASFSYSASTYCANDANPTPTITGIGGGSFSSTPGLSINSSTGVINLSASTPDTYTVTYTIGGSCPNSSNVTVTINALDDASFSYAESLYYKEGDNPIPTLTGLTGGTFSSTPSGLSLNATTGEIDVSASDPDTYAISYTTNGSCPNSSIVVVTIDDFSGVTFTYNTANGFLPQNPNGFNLTNNDLIVENGTAFISTETTFNKVTVQPNAVLDLDANISVVDKVLFESDATGTAQLDDATGVSITGNVEVERYIPAGQRAFRFVSPAVTTTTSIYKNWQENGASPTGFGTHITGSTTGANGFDETETGNPSLYRFNNALENQSGGAAWTAIANTNVNELEAGTPYRLFVRGDRTIDLTSNEITANETVLRARGNLQIGDFTPSISSFDGNFNFIGNPYQAAVDFKQLSFSGDVNDNYIYVWDPQLGETGSFVTIELLDGSNTVGSNANEFIQPGQAFFVRNNLTVNTAPSITFNEASKDVAEEQLSTFSTLDYAKINLQLRNTENTQISDGIGVRISENFENEVNDADAGKLGNAGENMAIVNSNQLLSIEQRGIPDIGEEIQLFINNFQGENYQLQLQLENWNEADELFIKDNYLETLTPITVEEAYNFSVDANIAESTSILRFSLVFGNVTLSDTNFENEAYSVYPNPTNNTLYVSGISESATIKVYDILGKEVFSQGNYITNEALDVSPLEAGIYLIKVEGAGSSFTHKIIKK